MATNYHVILTIIHSSSNKSALEIHNELTIQGKLGIFPRGTNIKQVEHDMKKEERVWTKLTCSQCIVPKTGSTREVSPCSGLFLKILPLLFFL